MRMGRAILALGLLAVLEVAFGGAVAVRGLSPDLLACFAAFVALTARPGSAIALAWVGGLAADILFGFRLGPFAFSFGAVAYLVAGVRSTRPTESYTVHGVVSFGIALVAHMAYWGLHTASVAAFGGFPVSFGEAVRTASGVAVYTAVAAPFVFAGLSRALRRRSVSGDILRDLTVARRQAER